MRLESAALTIGTIMLFAAQPAAAQWIPIIPGNQNAQAARAMGLSEAEFRHFTHQQRWFTSRQVAGLVAPPSPVAVGPQPPRDRRDEGNVKQEH